jgi:hypothetical protein
MDRCSCRSAEARVRNKHIGEGSALNHECTTSATGVLRNENPLWRKLVSGSKSYAIPCILDRPRSSWHCWGAVDWSEFWPLWIAWIHGQLKVTGVGYPNDISDGCR